jgi:hypothetical protein
MNSRLITVAETSLFERQADKIWNDAERTALIDHLARNPEAGDVIPGTNGVRKLRWGRAGTGKRGGSRVVYFFHNADLPLYLLLAYAKAQATDMTADEKRLITALAVSLKQRR